MTDLTAEEVFILSSGREVYVDFVAIECQKASKYDRKVVIMNYFLKMKMYDLSVSLALDDARKESDK
jgi:hypothetical protein